MRKLVGMFALTIGLGVYALACVHIATEFLPSHRLVELIYYITAGVAWAWPAKSLMVWMHANDAAQTD